MHLPNQPSGAMLSQQNRRKADDDNSSFTKRRRLPDQRYTVPWNATGSCPQARVREIMDIQERFDNMDIASQSKRADGEDSEEPRWIGFTGTRSCRYDSLEEELAAAKLNLPKAPATSFQLFPFLAPELRLRVWQLFSRHPRILEIQNGPMKQSLFFGTHLAPPVLTSTGVIISQRIAPLSRAPPAMLHVNQEARVEGLKVYSLRSFDACVVEKRFIYFNSFVDILYLRATTCLDIISICSSTSWKEHIPRLAIEVNESFADKWTDFMLTNGYFEGFGLTPHQILDGLEYFKPPCPFEGPKIRGCKGLKEIFWFKAAVQKEYREEVESGIGLRNTTQKKWTGEDKPVHHFVSLIPHSQVNGIQYDTLGVYAPIIGVLRRKWQLALKQIERRTGCTIISPEQEVDNEAPEWEIGFVGMSDAVVEAKRMVLEKLAEARGSEIIEVS
ncbi:hypothetical protein G7Y89_g4337 [Cudoniella acicularis]|uniref:2EXR domain-containing protein n=1 Tax=Cudoniella acicularis TaxID=354080 RepID=A0A8H4RPP6_9HELO|nr:hypothetical protein G7Y89_g4337 [Cudoniella acicularis]